jgi:hypothetical protein
MMKKLTSTFVTFVLMIIFAATASAALFTQIQSFTMYGDAKVSRTEVPLINTKTIDLEFLGAPASIVIDGNQMKLTNVIYDLTTKLDYMINVNCYDTTCFSDCYTEAGYILQEALGAGGLLFPDQERILYMDYKFPVVVHSETWTCEPAWGNYHKDVHEQPGQLFSMSANDYDLSFLYIDNFTVEIQRDLILTLFDWDTNDSINRINLSRYKWEGDLTISYEYEAVPIPESVWLLGSGLIALVGLGRKKR